MPLIDAQLSRTRIVAPFDAIVVKGDLSQSLGAPVERGNVLFELDCRPVRGDLGLGHVVGEVSPGVWGTDGYVDPEVLLVDEVLASSPRHAYPRVWGALTKAEMLLRQGLYQECQAQCEAALAALPEPTDKGLALRLRLILSEVLAQSGAFTEAGRVAVRARGGSSSA